MFGQDSMLFQTTIKIDKKNRITIPSKTMVEQNDKLILVKKDTYISMYNINVIENKINMLLKAKDKALFEGNKEFIEYLDNELKNIAISINNTVVADNQHRIILANDLKNEYNFNQEIYIQGEINHINLFKDENEFIKYRNKIKEKRSI